MTSILRYKIETVEIDIGLDTYKFISQNLPIQILNEYYGYKPLIKTVSDIPAEIKQKDTVTRRLKVTFIDDLTYIAEGSLTMASYWRLFIARNKNYKGKIIRYSRRIGDGDLELRFVGKIENITIANNGNVTIEAIDLLKAMSKIDYPFLSGISAISTIPAIFYVTTVNDLTSLTDAIKGDYGVVSQLGTITGANAEEYTEGSGDIPVDGYYFRVYAYNASGDVLARSVQLYEELTQGDAILITYNAYSGASYYRIFYKNDFSSSYTGYFQTTNTSYSFQTLTGITLEDIPAGAQNYYHLENDDFTDLDNWIYTPDPDLSIDIDGEISLLEDEGYLKIDDEIIYYDHIATDSEGYSLTGILRGQFGTEPQRHYIDTVFYFILAVQTPIDIFLQMKRILQLASIDDIYISTQFDTYALEGLLNVTTQPIIEEAKLSDIYFDLVNLADCMSFQNEDGLIDILKHTEEPAVYKKITDDANIIYSTPDIDLNEESRYTRWLLLWNRFDLEKKLDDDDAYGRGNITIDGDSEDFYEDSKTDKQHTAWLNAGTDAEITAANTYVNNLLNERRIRQREAQHILSAALEIKDDDIKLGDLVKIRTKKVIDENGISQLLRYRAIKKEPSAGRIKFNFIKIIESFSPLDLEGLYLWFPDFNLSNPSSNNFTWLDEISKTIQISGNYGTGDGIVLENNKNVLSTIGSTSCSINSSILNLNEVTFIGALQLGNLGSSNWTAHLVSDGALTNYFRLSATALIGGVYSGFQFRVIQGSVQIYSIGGANESFDLHPITIFVIKIKFATASDVLNLRLLGLDFSDEGNSFSKRSWTAYNLTGVGSSPMIGKLFEFMYYNRILTDEEINKVGNYYARKYNAEWVEI